MVKLMRDGFQPPHRMLSRRSVLGGAGLIGAAVSIKALDLIMTGSVQPAWKSSSWRPPHLDRFFAATDSPVVGGDLTVTTRQPSVSVGDSVAVTVTAFGDVDLAIFRLGWYDGVGALLLWHANDLAGVTTVDVTIDPSWGSGMYVAVVCPHGRRAPTRIHPFVVTDPSSDAAIVMQIPVTTYQAYNASGGASLYRFNSPNDPVTSVGLYRPFDIFDGAGFLYYGDLQTIWWLDREGFEVTYVSSLETHTQPDLMNGRRLFLSSFHDEYWSMPMRDHLQRWIAGGVNAAFLGANSLYWQVELSLNEVAGTWTMHCDKMLGGTQGTFRSNGRPEHLLLGSQYESYRFPYRLAAQDWVVDGAGHWLYTDTGLRNGDRIKGLVGYEWDRLPSNGVGDGVTVVADSPLLDGHRHHACVVERAGHGTVFNAGTNYWPRMLLDNGPWKANDAVQQITRNLLSELGR